MAITQDGLNKDQDEFNAAFAEDTPMAAEPSEDEAFGLNLDAAAAEDAGASQADGEPAAVVVAAIDGEELEQAAAEDQAKDTATSAADAGNAGETLAVEEEAAPAVDMDKEVQRLKSWEGRLKAMQAKLDAAGAKGEDEQTEAVSEAIEKAADAADTPADAEAVGQIAEQVESGELTAEQAMKQLAEDFGDDFVKMIEAIAVSKAKEAGAGAAAERFEEVNKSVEAIINDIVDTKAKSHFETIATAHPDFNDIGNSPEFATWVESLPDADQAEAKRVATAGSAKEIIKLLDGYKAAAQQPKADAEQPMDLANESAMDDAEGVRSTGMRLPQQPGAAEDDFLGAWEQF